MSENSFFGYILIAIGLCLFFNFIKLICRMHKSRKLERAREEHVRRTTVYTITSDPRGNDPANDFTDFFWDGLPHGSSSRNEPAKDDKDLPTYEEVMEMTRQAVGSTTTTPASNHTTTSVVTPVPASTV